MNIEHTGTSSQNITVHLKESEAIHYDYYLTSENGEIVAYKVNGFAPVIINAHKAIEILCNELKSLKEKQ